jgi:UDP-N-acetylmuramyl pentapeptide synthase
MIFSELSILKRLLKPEGVYNRHNFRPFDSCSIDSRSIKKGQAFLAIKGKHKDGHDFIKEALQKGACCIIAQ